MSIDPPDDALAEAWWRAAAAGDVEVLSQLLGDDGVPACYDERHYGPLHHAVVKGHVEAVRWLLEHGANVDAHDAANIGDTALCLAVRGDELAIVDLLLKHGANPDLAGWMGQTARTRAARRQDATGQRIAERLSRVRRRE